ncbi:MAG: AbrB/MazE/SpoVT family DNA-binding domain-containing protein [Candidatus Woesearchaeota archaeon]
MELIISKWGNSYAVRLPKNMIKELDVQEKSVLVVKREKEGFLIKKKEKELENMLKNITPREELDWGDKHGREVW